MRGDKGHLRFCGSHDLRRNPRNPLFPGVDKYRCALFAALSLILRLLGDITPLVTLDSLLRTSPLSIAAVSGSLYHQWNFVCIVGHLLVRRAWCNLLKYILDFTNCRFYFATATPHNRLHDNLVENPGNKWRNVPQQA